MVKEIKASNTEKCGGLGWGRARPVEGEGRQGWGKATGLRALRTRSGDGAL